jgi:molecular chaperone GrpE
VEPDPSSSEGGIGSGPGSVWDDLGAAVGVEKPADSVDPEPVPLEDTVAPPDSSVDAVPDDESAEDAAVHEAEAVVEADIAQLAAERDDYLDQLRRLNADFDNYRKRVLRQQTEHLERAAEGLVERLLDTLDTFDAALAHGEGFEQVHATLMSVLGKEGLERIDPAGKAFDPEEADAVMHEEGDGGPVVTDVLRPGYRWKGRVLRPAMVRVKG